MSSLIASIAEVKELAVKAQLSVEQIANAAVVLNDRQNEIDASRRALPNDRAGIDAYLKTIDGAINPDLSASDICLNAGVRFNRGTSQYATRAKQRLLADMRR
jgi:hypothetical protein